MARSSSVAQAAERLGFAYAEKGDAAFKESFRYLGGVPAGATIRHVMTGELDGRRTIVFESSYMIHTGQAPIPITHTIYCAEAPDWPLTKVTPRNFLGQLTLKLFKPSGLVLDDPEFTRRFKVRADHEDFAITLLSPEMQAFMLTKRNVRWHIGYGRVCLVYSGGLKPDRIEASRERLRGFLAYVAPELHDW